MRNVHDLYPTRAREPIERFERLDPVVHTDGGEHWHGPLSAEELASFEKNGFLFLESFFSEDEVRSFRRELRHLASDPEVTARDGAILEPESQDLRTLFEIHRRDVSPHLSELARDARLVDRARQLLASDVYIHQSRINYKPGFRGKGFNWHSDFETWHAEDGMPRMRAVSASIVLTDNHEFNGPLMLVPGSHRTYVPSVGETPDDNYRTSLKVQEIGVPDEGSLAALIAEGGIEAPKGPAGSVLLFECNTLHGSNANMSPDPRSNAFFVYNSVRNRPQAPFAANKPRPAFLGEREDFTPIEPTGHH